MLKSKMINSKASGINSAFTVFLYIFLSINQANAQSCKSSLPVISQEQTQSSSKGMTTLFGGISNILHRGLKFIKSAKKEKTGKTLNVYDFNKKAIPVSVLSLEEGKNIFQNLAANPTIPFGHITDGCEARAHMMSYLMNQRNLIPAKILLSSRIKGLTVEVVDTTSTKDNKKIVKWDYHIAPVLFLEENGKSELYVLDPSIFQQPVPYQTWLDKQVQHIPLEIRSPTLISESSMARIAKYNNSEQPIYFFIDQYAYSASMYANPYTTKGKISAYDEEIMQFTHNILDFCQGELNKKKTEFKEINL